VRVGQGYEHTRATGEIKSILSGNRKLAADFADNVLPTIKQFRNSGGTLPAIAEKLNAMGVKTRRGGKQYASTVFNVLKRAA
jgi:hypothetical protein